MHNLLNELTNQDPNIKIDDQKLGTILEKTQNENISWIIRFFAAFGAWLSMSTFMGFLGLAELFESGEATIITGLLFLIVSLILSNKINHHLFLEPLILALGMIGQVCIVAGFATLRTELESICLIILVMASIVFYFTNSQTQAFLSIISFCSAILGLLFEMRFFGAIHFFIGILVIITSLLLLLEEKMFIIFNKFLNFYNTILLALSISITGLLGTYGFASTNKYALLDKEWGMFIEFGWLSSVITIVCSIFIIIELLKEVNIQKIHLTILSISISILLGTTFFMSAGISWSILLILLGVFRSQKIILGIGILSFLYFLGLFYYGLHITFLAKSIALMISGFLFIAVGVFIRLKFGQNDEK